MTRRLVTTIAALGSAALALTTAACGTGADSGTTSAPTVMTSFYPIQFATEQIAGKALDVRVLTKPGAEPHDLEIGAQDLDAVLKAALVVYSKGFQPAVDDAASQADRGKVLDVSSVARLTLTGDEEEHAGETAEEHAEHEGNDPHFWLDPKRYADVAQAIEARLAQLDPARASTFKQNGDAFVAKLTALDEEFTTGLKSCRIKELVTSHSAFTYLADRYGFEQHGIAGVSPEAEPSAAGLKEITDLVKEHGVTTIYQETLVEPHFAKTVASSTGAQVATLDPIEGITGSSAGKDYFEVMRSNLKALQQGQACS